MRLLNGFASDKRGNISIMFAFMLVLVLLFTGGAIDYTRRNAVRADLIDSLDAAGLAMAQLD
ncbi:MAG TPA: pilus assembly protein TadG-related protein, partial [Parvularculaceae bacterium]|nr:pilus assembly protein TadG-related protein [Parvularculaceae bacterium]